MVFLDAIVLKAPMSFAPISNEHQFTGTLKVLSTRYEAMNIHLNFLSHVNFSYPKIIGFLKNCVDLCWMPNILSPILPLLNLHFAQFFTINKACNLCPILRTFEIPKVTKLFFKKFNHNDFPYWVNAYYGGPKHAPKNFISTLFLVFSSP